jgi:hypothetical protein
METNKSRKGIPFSKNPIRSPQKEREKELQQASRSRDGHDYDSTSRLLQKVDKAIHFKKKDPQE